MARHAPPPACQKKAATSLAVASDVLRFDDDRLLAPDIDVTTCCAEELSLSICCVVAEDGGHSNGGNGKSDTAIPYDRMRRQIEAGQSVYAR